MVTELLDITDARNQSAVLPEKPVSEDASPKFNATEHAKGQ